MSKCERERRHQITEHASDRVHWMERPDFWLLCGQVIFLRNCRWSWGCSWLVCAVGVLLISSFESHISWYLIIQTAVPSACALLVNYSCLNSFLWLLTLNSMHPPTMNPDLYDHCTHQNIPLTCRHVIVQGDLHSISNRDYFAVGRTSLGRSKRSAMAYVQNCFSNQALLLRSCV